MKSDKSLSISGSDNVVKTNYKYSDLTGKIIGCAMKVHKILGNGFQEVIYQSALEKEMDMHSMLFEREFEMPIIYKAEHIGTRRVYFLVEELISVEIKANTKLKICIWHKPSIIPKRTTLKLGC